MDIYHIRLRCTVETTVTAATIEEAAALANRMVQQAAPDSEATLMGVFREGCGLPPPEPEDPPTPPRRPWGRPNGGGTPGTPVLAKPVMTEAVAVAA